MLFVHNYLKHKENVFSESEEIYHLKVIIGITRKVNGKKDEQSATVSITAVLTPPLKIFSH